MLVTGTPIGNIVSQEELYTEGAPYLYIQNAIRPPRYNPDEDGYYWNMSGTAAYPVKNLGCVIDVTLGQGITMNMVRCDQVGDKSAVQRRDHVEFTFTMQNMLPLSALADVLNLSPATLGAGTEKVGIGGIDNTKYWMVYAPKVYDDVAGDYIAVHLHRAQFVEPSEIQMRGGENWSVQVKVRAFADDTKPSAQKFGTLIRGDQSALP